MKRGQFSPCLLGLLAKPSRRKSSSAPARISHFRLAEGRRTGSSATYMRRYAATPNSAFNSGRTVDSLVEWDFVWEDQACLVPVSDWPMRALIREKYRPYHDREILQAEAEIASGILETIDARGPLSSLEFEDRQRVGADHS